MFSLQNRIRFNRLARTAAVAAAMTAAAPAAAHAGEPAQDLRLRVGDAVFVDGPRGLEEPVVVAPHPLLDPTFCDGGLQACFDYQLTLLEPGERLRVGLDTRRGGYQIYLLDPAGREVATDAPPFNADFVVERPAVGTWKVRVAHVAQGDTAFRIRARLEGAGEPVAEGPKVLLPNLRMQPPFAFTLETPGSASGFLDEPRSRGAVPTRGCLPTEIGTFGARRCLRFSTGPENVGAGRLQLLFEPDEANQDGKAFEGNAFQLVDRRDGSTERRTAGDYVYHAQHTHFHHAGFAGFQLLRVTDSRRGHMAPAGSGPKQGFCMADVRIVNWFAFDNVLDSIDSTNCMGIGDDPTAQMRTGLGVGWADIYAYYQEGMFVDFADNPDGLYVVRVRANDRDVIHETKTGDNVSYAFLEVAGDEVAVFERGYGDDPWDPRKRIVHDLVPTTVAGE